MSCEQVAKKRPKKSQVGKQKPQVRSKKLSITGEHRAKIKLITRAQEDFDKLFLDCEQVIQEAVHNFPGRCSPADQAMLFKWNALGKGDFDRDRRPYFTRAIGQTLTVFGLACLESYARGWLLAAEDWESSLQRTLPHGAPKV